MDEIDKRYRAAGIVMWIGFAAQVITFAVLWPITKYFIVISGFVGCLFYTISSAIVHRWHFKKPIIINSLLMLFEIGMNILYIIAVNYVNA